jgi:hypothetical protein
MHRPLHHAAFLAGLAALAWVGAGYVATHPLALAVVVAVGAFYLMGALELQRFRADTAGLARALADMADPLPSFGDWLRRLPPGLQNAVRLRVEGERVALPGPALAPYLTALLVLLGMLGTFLGMVATLNGTGTALGSATDLPAVRAALAAPVQGLGLAFGTSVAGIAASAMLGLMAALCRRERLRVAHTLDTRIATTLRVFSPAHRRDESFALLQQHAQLMPQLVERMQAMAATLERQGQAMNERLLASQDGFQRKAEAAYGELAASVDRSLRTSLAESARVAGATIQPVVDATMAGIARETASLQQVLSQSAERQLDGLSTRFEASATAAAGLWKSALAEHQRTSEALSRDLRGSLDRFAETFDRRSAALLGDVSARLESTAGRVSEAWRQALADQQRAGEALSRDTHQALTSAAATFERHAEALLRTVGQAHADLHTESASRDKERLAAWSDALATMAGALKQEWQHAGERILENQQQVCTTLARTAGDITAQSEAHARHTIAEIARLVQAASEAPRAAAEVIAGLREQLSDSSARDHAMLEERARLMQTLGTLLDAVNHSSVEQRAAIEALVASSADMLQRAGDRFSERAEAEAGKMAAVAAQLTGSAVEMASLGEAFGFAVQLFSASNDKLAEHLQRVEAALSRSTARSDEQLAYYVAQAREVIDLSLLSQKQIVEDLQQLAGRQALAASEVAA